MFAISRHRFNRILKVLGEATGGVLRAMIAGGDGILALRHRAAVVGLVAGKHVSHDTRPAGTGYQKRQKQLCPLKPVKQVPLKYYNNVYRNEFKAFD